MSSGTARSDQAAATRNLILSAAERLFAEHGVAAVSNRQVGQAAGQGNNTVVGYHFGTKADLVRAIVRRHAEPVEEMRARMVAETEASADVRDWVACMVRPMTQHLADQGVPTWYARFSAQIMTDPAYRRSMVEESLNAPSLARASKGLRHCLPDLPPEVRAERTDMARHLMIHMVAERERALAEDAPTPRPTWHASATGLIDALTALWTAPASTEPAVVSAHH